jgi:hypothetical protein
MENPNKMSTPDLAPDANIEAMNIATPGKDGPNPDKSAPKRALFSSLPPDTYKVNQDQQLNTINDREAQHSGEPLGDPARRLHQQEARAED